MDTGAIARRLVEIYNKGSPDWVNECHAATTEWIELPFLGGPGRQGGFAELRKAAEDQAQNFPDRRMEILNLVTGADQAALEVEWSGTAARTMAWAEAGQTLRLRAVMILKMANGRVVREVDYVIPLS
jgi:ketosteroid isomerase-like protein